MASGTGVTEAGVNKQLDSLFKSSIAADRNRFQETMSDLYKQILEDMPSPTNDSFAAISDNVLFFCKQVVNYNSGQRYDGRNRYPSCPYGIAVTSAAKIIGSKLKDHNEVLVLARTCPTLRDPTDHGNCVLVHIFPDPRCMRIYDTKAVDDEGKRTPNSRAMHLAAQLNIKVVESYRLKTDNPESCISSPLDALFVWHYSGRKAFERKVQKVGDYRVLSSWVLELYPKKIVVMPPN